LNLLPLPQKHLAFLGVYFMPISIRGMVRSCSMFLNSRATARKLVRRFSNSVSKSASFALEK